MAHERANPAGDGGFRFKTEMQVRFRDLDPLNHVNNAVYLTYFETARIAYWAALTGASELRELGQIVAEVTCTYRSPATLNERFDVWVAATRLGRTSFDYAYRIEDQASGRLIATGRSVQVMYDYAAGRPIPIPDDLRVRFAAFERRAFGG